MSDLIEMGSEYEDGNGEVWVILTINGLTENYPVVAQRKTDGFIRKVTRMGIFDIRMGDSEFDFKKVEPCKYVVIFEYCSRVIPSPAEIEVQQNWGKWIATVKYKVGQDDSES